MSTDNLKVDQSKLLNGMYRDGYFPNQLVDKVRAILLDACREIESKNPANHQELYDITCRATERINDLQDEFEENNSEIETVARDDIGGSFSYIASVHIRDRRLFALIAARECKQQPFSPRGFVFSDIALARGA